MKSNIVAGFREGRSPDVLGVTGSAVVLGTTGEHGSPGASAPWPSTSALFDTRVPIAFWGPGVATDALVPEGATLDRVAPTVAAALRFDRPFPEVRAGRAIAGVADGDIPRLVLEVAWKGVGTADLEAQPGEWRFLRSLLRAGAGTLAGATGSLPLDPAATLTTIGTGGPPSQHGITGTLVRNDRGDVTGAWQKGSPLSIIAALPDDLDHELGERPLVGLIATDEADRGIIGGTWYVPHDRDDLAVVPGVGDQAEAVERMLSRGYGTDSVPDILAVVMRGSVGDMDESLRRVVAVARRAADGSILVVVAGTGTTAATVAAGRVVASGNVLDQVNAAIGLGESIVEAAVPGGLFLDQVALARAGVGGQVVQISLLGTRDSQGRLVMADAFQAFAVSFARYC
ncbi:MAG: hypothetical protein ACT4PO_12185 [Actinomycetota bacterium]